MRRTGTQIRLVLTSVMLVIAAFAPLHTAQAAGTTYYINNRSGSNCNNTNPGTATSAPWCDFTNVNNRTFGAGDQILLARGATWNQELDLNGTGTASNFITVDAYDVGAMPKIIRNGNAADRGIRLINPSYWQLRHLEIGSAGAGILVYFTTLAHEGLKLSDLYLHDIRGIHQGNRFTTGNINCTTTDKIWNSAGIEVTGDLTFGPNDYALRNVTLSGIEGSANQDTISFDWCNGQSASDGSSGDGLVQQVVISDLYLHDDNGPAEGCDEGMRLVNMRDVIIVDSRLIREAGCYSGTGTAGILFGGLRNVTFVNSIMTDVPDTSSNDQGGFDYEASTTAVGIRNSLIARNAGPGIEFLAIHGPTDYSTNNEVSGNLLVNNAAANASQYLGGIGRIGNDMVPTGVIRDNLYVETSGLLSGDFRGFTIQNNRSGIDAARAFYAADGFSGTQGDNGWRYQASNENAASWSDLVYDSTARLWKPTSGATVPQIGQFSMHPEVCSTCWVARTWVAPNTGTVSIRGRVLKRDTTGGDGVRIRITKNGAVLWGPQSIQYNDQIGVETNLDDISVASGDNIRFEIANNGDNTYDSTSWTPGIAYTAINQLTVANASFESPALSSYAYGPINNAGWSFGNGTGIQHNGSAWGKPSAIDGVQAAFVQSNGAASCFSQNIASFAAGTAYTLSFAAAQRSGSLGGQTIQVYLDSTLLATYTPATSTYTTQQVANLTASAGTHTLMFCGAVGGDHAAFVDHIHIYGP